MGSCYSCRSNGGLPTYTTVAMATNTTDTNAPAVAGRGEEKSGRSLSMRSSGGGSFGFRKKTPVSVKSQSKERTSELVHLYETKISNLCNTNNSRHSSPSSTSPPLSSPIILGSSHERGLKNNNPTSVTYLTSNQSTSVANTHFGLMGSQNNQKYLGGGEISDANCNYNNNNISNDNERCFKVETFSNRERFFMLGNSTSKYEYGFGRDNKFGPKSEDLRNGNVEGDKREENRIKESAKIEVNTKLPFMVKTQMSGLPRPQIPVLVEKKVGSSKRSPEDELNVDVNEGDSGLGNSLSEKLKNEGDNETLADVEQIEGDSISVSSRGNRKESPDAARTLTSVDSTQSKLIKPSGIARFKYNNSPVNMPVKVVIPSQPSSPKINAAERKQILSEKSSKESSGAQIQSKQMMIVRKVPLSVQLSNKSQQITNKTITKKGVELRKSTKSVASVRGATVGGRKSYNGGEEWAALTELRQKENITPEVVDVIPINLANAGKIDNVAKTCGVYKSSRIECVLPSNFHDAKEIKKSNSFHMEAAEIGHEQASHDLGPYSPPSEKDFFLIDDEIADQPALIACQELPNMKEHRVYKPTAKLSSVLSDMNEEGGLPAMAHVQASPCQRRKLSRSVDTLSPCSSLDSDDLMLDFEKLEDGIQSRPLSEVFGDGFQLNSVDGKAAEHFLLAKLKASMEGTPSRKHSSSSTVLDSGSRRSSLSQKSNWIFNNNCKVASSTATADDVLLAGPNISAQNQHMLSTDGLLYNNSTTYKDVNSETDAYLDIATFRLLTQDITNVKTLLLRLKRVLQENGLMPTGVPRNEKVSTTGLEQENADLRRQIVFLQQQLEDRDRTIRHLQQQQLPKRNNNLNDVEAMVLDKKDVSTCNAACQTERQRSALNSFLTSVNDESAFGSTVSNAARFSDVPS